MRVGIYKITNTDDGKVYIGQTINYRKRLRSHISHLIAGTHSNEHLQRAWKKCGQDKFLFETLEACQVSQLDAKEKAYIDKYNSADSRYGYNLIDGGQKFRSFNQELRDKLSCSLKGRRFSEQHKQRISESNKGRIIPALSIAKARQTRLSRMVHVGQKNPNATISDITAGRIIRELDKGIPVKLLAENYKVSNDVVYNLMYNKTYKHILPLLREAISNRVITQREAIEKVILEKYCSGLSQNKIARELNVSRNTIRAVLKDAGINTRSHVNQYVNTEANGQIAKG